MMENFLTTEWWGNTVNEYLIALGVFLALLVFFYLLQRHILKKLRRLAEKTPTDIDNTILNVINKVRPGFYVFLAFYITLQTLTLPETATQIITWILIIWVGYLVVMAGHVILDYIFTQKLPKLELGTKEALRTLNNIAKASLWVLAVLFILSNLGVNVTSAMAGLGIGGIAVALALQNILNDLFSSFSIHFDKPFLVGDFIIIGDKMGTVERIGVKTSRLRALQGEELVISNQELTSAQIQNFKKMESRRAIFNFGVVYRTPTEKLKQIPEIINGVIEKIELAELDRVHFNKFGQYALEFEVVYYTLSAEYNDYMDTQQAINFGIKEAFEAENIEMAFPTQTVHLVK